MSSNFPQGLWIIRVFMVEVLPMTSIELPLGHLLDIFFLSSVLIKRVLITPDFAAVVLLSPVSFIFSFIMFSVDNLLGIIVEIKYIIPLVDAS